MHRWLLVAALAVSAGGCTTPHPPDRLTFGVSGDRVAGATTAADDAEMRRFLDARINEICTLGYDTVKIDTLAAENNKQLVDEEARCHNYHLTLF